MQTEIFEYVKTKRGRVGVLFGAVVGGTINIGWSRCNKKAGDKFDSDLGIQIAEARAKIMTDPIPHSFNHQARKFGSRCIRYFKDAKALRLPA